jgi:hypothetical protein
MSKAKPAKPTQKNLDFVLFQYSSNPLGHHEATILRLGGWDLSAVDNRSRLDLWILEVSADNRTAKIQCEEVQIVGPTGYIGLDQVEIKEVYSLYTKPPKDGIIAYPTHAKYKAGIIKGPKGLRFYCTRRSLMNAWNRLLTGSDPYILVSGHGTN